ncbi:MAG: hypothetical protein QOC82_835 [Frankiaceae bacterium]|jgi:hypothetical protein|nr:hypothetical protein [Frankiaceae bacterium]
MRLTRTAAIAGLAVVAALAGTVAHAGAAVDRATGGGQILLSSSGHGPGDTIAFTAQQDAGGAKGRVNVIDRVQDTTGQGVHFRGTVECVVAQGNTAKIAGHGVNDDGTTTGFTLVVVDNGEARRPATTPSRSSTPTTRPATGRTATRTARPTWPGATRRSTTASN